MSKAKDVAILLAVCGVGYAGVKFSQFVKDGLDAGAKLPEAVKDAAVAVADAVNPLSQNNVAIRGANAVASKVAGRETTLGGEVYEVLDGFDKKVESFVDKLRFWKKRTDPSDVSNSSKQIEIMELAKEKFREQEIEAMNAQSAPTPDYRRENFRLSEIREQNKSTGVLF